MLNLTRLGTRRPCLSLSTLRRAAIVSSQPSCFVRFQSDSPFLGGSGSLSVPIPLEARQVIRLGKGANANKASINNESTSSTTTTTPTTRAKKSQRQLRKERMLALRQKNNRTKGNGQVKANSSAKAKTVDDYAERKSPPHMMEAEPKTSPAMVYDLAQEGSSPNKDFGPKEIDEVIKETAQEQDALTEAEELGGGRINAGEISITEVTPLREMKVARLAHGLHRVLFSPGVIPFRDLRTGVWNFPWDFMNIPTPEEYAFDRSPQYITPSQDEELLSLAKREKCKFIGSTSTLTGAFSQIYFAISGGKGVDLSTFSQSFASERSDFTYGAELPAVLKLGPLEDGRYYVDSDKSFDTENILSDYGVILEKLLVTDRPNFKRFLNSSPPESVSEAERNEKEAYRYSKFGSLMMRSQLDCQDDRLPGSGVFDVKTRACLPIRHDRGNYLHNSQYSILKEKGAKLSFEKEYYDIVRSGMLKWSMQARIGGMDGIFVAYHNCQRLFGFQYLPMAEIDERIFGSSEMATQAFNLVVSLFEVLIQHCADAFPGKELSVVIRRASGAESKTVLAYVTPTGEGPQPIQTITMNLTSYINGRRINRLLDNDNPGPQEWTVDYTISKSGTDAQSTETSRSGLRKAIKDVSGISQISVPEGKTVEEMSSTKPGVKWKNADKRITELREEAKKSGEAYAKLKSGWKDDIAWKAPTKA